MNAAGLEEGRWLALRAFFGRLPSPRLGLAVVAVVAYCVIFLPPAELFGVCAACVPTPLGLTALTVIPVGLVAWALGPRAGVLAGVGALPLNTVLLNLASPGAGPWVLVKLSSLPAVLALVIVALAIGYLHRVDARLKVELGRLSMLKGALRESEARKSAILDSSADCIIAVDLAGSILEFNSAAEQTFGYRSAYAVGIPMVDLIVPSRLRVEIWRALSDFMAVPDHSSTGRHLETMAQRSNGSELPVEISLGLHSDGGQTVCSASLRDITDRKRQEAALEYQAYHDALTDLPNRVLFRDRLEQATLAAERGGTTVAVLLLDLNGFKAVNDTLGHHVGDLLLQQVAQRLRGEVRASDTVARLGGDEFAVILPEVAGLAAAETLAKKIKIALRVPYKVDGHRLKVSASIGIALYPDHGEDAETLVRRSDAAMYQAKRSRRGHTVAAGAKMSKSPQLIAQA